MYELDPRSLSLVGDECLSICQAGDEFSEPLGPLIQKYRDLGQRLKELSRMIQASGRSQQYYPDQELVKHVHGAKTDLEKHYDSRVAHGWLRLHWTDRLNDDKIEKLHRQVDEHVRVARDFKTGFLLDIRDTRLEALIAKLVEAGAINSQLSAFDGLAKSPKALVASPTARKTDQTVSANARVENGKTNHLADDFSGALKLARVVWKGRADIAHQHRVHQRRDIGRDSAKGRFIHDVVSLIEETRLYTADIDVADNDPQKVLDRLIEIVSKAVQLKHAVGSPAIRALDNNGPPSTCATRETPTSLPPVEKLIIQTVTRSESLEPPSWSTLELPPAVKSPIEWNWPPEHETFLNNDTLNVKEVLGDSGVSGSQPQNAHNRERTSSSPSEARPSQNLDRAADGSYHEPRVQAGGHTDVPSLRQNPLGDWVKVFIPQIMLQPALCTLEIDQVRGEAVIETTIVPRRESTGSVQGKVSFGSRDSTSGSGSSVAERDPRRTYTTRITHFFQERPRSIPSIKHPNYEGLTICAEKPYTIRFRDPQVLKEEGSLDRLQSVSDIEYIFSCREQRNKTLPLLFGKTLLASAGVKRIEFGAIVCLREAVNLWYDGETKCSTITFLQGVKDQRSGTLKAVEYEIVGIEQCDQAACEDAPVVVYVKSTSHRPQKRQRCSIYFSEASGRKKIMDVLQPP